MIQEYTEEMFEKDKEDMLEWLENNWKWGRSYQTYLGNILLNLRNWIEAWYTE